MKSKNNILKILLFLTVLLLNGCSNNYAQNENTNPADNPSENNFSETDIIGSWKYETAEFKDVKISHSKIENQLKSWLDANKQVIVDAAAVEMSSFVLNKFEFMSGGKLNIYHADGSIEHVTYNLTGNKLEVTVEDGWKIVYTVSVSGNKLYLDSDLVEIVETFPKDITSLVVRFVFAKKN